LRGRVQSLITRAKDRRLWLWIAMVGVLALAAVARTVALTSQPGGLYPDEGAEALDAYKLLHLPGFHPVYFHDDGGREALYAYLVAVAFRVGGETVLALRALSAIIGILAVAALYPALRRFGQGAALAAMAWAAGALWLVCIARDGMRNILVALFAAMLLWALTHWADRPGRGAALAAGAVAGAGLWTYQPMKLTPLLVALWLLWIRHRSPALYQQLKGGLGWFILAFALVAAPMLLTAIFDPVDYFGRVAGVSPLNPTNSDINLLTHTLRTLGMFVVTGDPNPRHDVASLPLLGWPLFLLAGAGAWRAWRHRDDPAHALLLVALPVFILPPLLAVDGGAPHFLRSIALAPVLAGLIGLGVLELFDLSSSRLGPRMAPAIIGAFTLLFAGLGAGSMVAYFSRPVSDRYHAYSYDVVELAQAAKPGDAVVIDDYNRIDVEFLTDVAFDDSLLRPRIFTHGSQIPDPARYAEVLALSREDLSAAMGAPVDARVRVIARTTDGRPAVWGVVP
jgi:4-amino-4-deoxy-L-arabinose transferase-like glycosyltransferase